MFSRTETPIDQATFMKYCEENKIYTFRKVGWSSNQLGICSYLTNKFIDDHLEDSSNNFFSSLKIIHTDDENKSEKLKIFVEKLMEFKCDEVDTFLYIPNRLLYNTLIFYNSGIKKQQEQFEEQINNLKCDEAIHGTIGSIHSFAIVKEKLNNRFYYKVYDPNNVNEPKLLTKPSEVFDEVYKTAKLIKNDNRNFFQALFTTNDNVITFFIFNKKIPKNLIQLVNELREIKDNEDILCLLNSFDKQKISLITLLSSSVIVLADNEGLKETIESALKSEKKNSLFHKEKNEIYQTPMYTNIPGQGNITLLHQVAYNGDLEYMKYLFENGFKDNIGDNSGHLAIHLAISRGHFSLVYFMLKSKQYDIHRLHEFKSDFIVFNQKFSETNQRSLLHEAIKYGRLELIKLLIEEFNADPNLMQVTKGWNPSKKSSIQLTKNIDIQRYLLKQTHHPLDKIIIRYIDTLSINDMLQNNFFKEITIDGCDGARKITLEEAKEITSYIETNKTLQKIDLSTCEFTHNVDTITDLFNKALLNNDTLIELKLPEDIKISDEAQQKILNNIKNNTQQNTFEEPRVEKINDLYKTMVVKLSEQNEKKLQLETTDNEVTTSELFDKNKITDSSGIKEKIILALDEYINSRENEWNYHYNFLGIVAVVYLIHDAFAKTDYFNSKSKTTKINIATRLKTLMETSEPIALNDIELQSLNDGRLGYLIEQYFQTQREDNNLTIKIKF